MKLKSSWPLAEVNSLVRKMAKMATDSDEIAEDLDNKGLMRQRSNSDPQSNVDLSKPQNEEKGKGGSFTDLWFSFPHWNVVPTPKQNRSLF